MSSTKVLEITSKTGWLPSLRRGWSDISAGFGLRETWMFLGWQEVRKQYRRSVIGPFWITLNMGIMVGALGLLYSKILHQNVTEFLPYLTVGFIVWNLISGLVNESCAVFTMAEHSVRQAKMPLSIYCYQLVWRQFVLFLHNFTVYLVVAVIFGIWPGAVALMAIPAIAIVLLTGLFIGFIMGPLSARFRDIPPITASITQIFFFVTPVFWTTSALPERSAVTVYNPFYHFLAIVRAPLLGHAPSPFDWIICLGITAVLGVLSILFFSRTRARIPYWA